MNTQSQTLFERHQKRRRKTPPNGAWAERVLANQSELVLPFVGDKASSVVEVQARVNKSGHDFEESHVLGSLRNLISRGLVMRVGPYYARKK